MEIFHLEQWGQPFEAEAVRTGQQQYIIMGSVWPAVTPRLHSSSRTVKRGGKVITYAGVMTAGNHPFHGVEIPDFMTSASAQQDPMLIAWGRKLHLFSFLGVSHLPAVFFKDITGVVHRGWHWSCPLITYACYLRLHCITSLKAQVTFTPSRRCSSA